MDFIEEIMDTILDDILEMLASDISTSDMITSLSESSASLMFLAEGY